MAELPDLTVFAKSLNHRFKGKTLTNLHISVDKKLNVTAVELKRKLEHHKLQKVERVGKTLQFHFGEKNILGLHLMLRGELEAIDDDQAVAKHAIMTFYFTGGSGFVVTDVLKQATGTLNPPENNTPDALEISESNFITLLSNRKKKIKEVLMDQKALRGIGNSYADEILWDARISPNSIAKALPTKVAKELHASIIKVLKEAIDAITKENKDELRGELRDFMKIHGAHIKRSPTGRLIKSEKMNGRTAYYTDEQELYR